MSGVGINVGETGWPTAGGNVNLTTPKLAETFSRNLLKHACGFKDGDAHEAKRCHSNCYIFFSQHFGLLHPDGTPK